MTSPAERRRRPRPSHEAIEASAVAALFIALSLWWLLYDQRIPGAGDPPRHLFTALVAGQQISSAEIGGLFALGPDGGFFYPPLVHAIGGFADALGLAVEDWGTFALNLVFVPMLAAGCFGVGRLVYGPRAGLLAVVFALGTPMVLSLFHVFLLDAPLAGSIAVTLWALLASDGLRRRPQAIVAGALIGVSLLVKTPAPLYVAGPLAVILIRGGWREWRNLALLALAALAVAGPYYAMHLGQALDLSTQTTGSGELSGKGVLIDPNAVYDRYSIDHLMYYGWVAINLQYFVPLLALFAVGLVHAIRGLRRPLVGELLAGLVVGYLATTFALSIRDPRYTLPLIVYVAVIATGWIGERRTRAVRIAAVALLAAAVGVNVATSVTDRLPALRQPTPGTTAFADLVDPWTFTFVYDRGWDVGPPRPDPLYQDLLGGLADQGVERIRVNVRQPAYWGSDTLGFEIAARRYGLIETQVERSAGPPQAIVDTWQTQAADLLGRAGGRLPRPCATIGEGIYYPTSSDPVSISVAVQRRLDDGSLRRWCRF